MGLQGLSAEQVATFERDGYLIVPDALPQDAVAALLAETRRMLEQDFKLEGHPMTRFQTGEGPEGEGHVGDEYFLESGDKVRFFFEEDAFDAATGQLAKPKERAINKIGHCLHGRNPVFARVTATGTGPGTGAESGGGGGGAAAAFANALIVGPVARSLGFRDPRCLQSMVICKQPEIGGAVPPHQDSTFLYTDPPSAVGFWYALEDATVDNGCLSFVPGSHRTAPVRQRLVRRDGGGTHMVDNDGAQFPLEIGEAGAPSATVAATTTTAAETGPHDASRDQYVLGEVKAGTLVLIHGNLLHKSEKNLSQRGRIIYTFHVIEGDGPTYDNRNWLKEPAGGFTQLLA